jgi:hypothetical protein
MERRLPDIDDGTTAKVVGADLGIMRYHGYYSSWIGVGGASGLEHKLRKSKTETFAIGSGQQGPERVERHAEGR